MKGLPSGYTIQAGGPVAERFRQRTHNPWGNPKQVRLLPGPPFPLRNAQTERIIEYCHSRLPQAAELEGVNVFRIPGHASRETWSLGGRWREGIGILDLLVICPRAPRGLTDMADGVGAK